MGTPAASVQVV